MVTKSRYVTPVYRGQRFGRKRGRKRKIFFIMLAVLLVLYLCYAAYSRRDIFIKKTAEKPINSPAGFTAVQQKNGKFKFLWSSVKDVDGYRVYRYNNETKKYELFKNFDQKTTSFFSSDKNGNYAVKSYRKLNKKYKFSKNFTHCKVTSISDMVEIVGHRGAMDKAPENTLAAYKKAYETGYAGFETDYWETNTGDLIISHDRIISPATGVEENIKNLTEEDRMDYPIVNGINIKKYTTQYMPLFEEAIQSAARYKMNIYLHTKNEELSQGAIEKIKSIITKYNMLNKATVFTSKPSILNRFKKSDLRAGFLVLPESEYDINNAINISAKYKADVLIMRYTKYLKKEQIINAHKYNIKVGCYDTSDLNAAFTMVDFNVDFLITNKDFIS